MRRSLALVLLLLAVTPRSLTAQNDRADVGRADLAQYFARETAALRAAPLPEIQTLDDWNARRDELRRQLLDMLGLDPMPPRTELHPVVTGRVESDEFTVEKLHFQSRPGLYVTANLYLPREMDKPVPAILYVCGHGAVKKDGISYGNKVHYQHHGAWFARNGYACLIIDSLQLGEIEGIHHGTYRYDRWWWIARGYTPAGVEAWNCIRALDYLATRPEIDMQRVGVTGRSGGGAYSWWIAAIDDRIAAAVPTAGITDLEDHVVDGAIEGHCDCMFMVNTYRWDYPQVAALVAPRALLLSNTDRDPIFPLEGVVRTHREVRRIYDLFGKPEQLGLNITAGGHQDTQELQVHCMRWMNHFLRGDDGLVVNQATKFFEPEQLRVFDKLPEDEINTTVDEVFVPRCADLEPPSSAGQWEAQTRSWHAALVEKTFRAWPEQPVDPEVKLLWSAGNDGVALSAFEFTSQPSVNLPMWVLHADGKKPQTIVLRVLDSQQWDELEQQLAADFPDHVAAEPAANARSARQLLESSDADAVAFLPPRGIGPTRLPDDPRKRTQILRRYYLLGQTLDGMQVWDVCQAIRTIRSLPQLHEASIRLQARGTMAGIAVYASLFERELAGLELERPPRSHEEGPCLMNVLRFMDMPHAIAMAAKHTPVVLYDDEQPWSAVALTQKAIGAEARQFTVRAPSFEAPKPTR